VRRLENLPGNGEEDNLRVNKSAEDGELGTVIPADINPADDELRTNDDVDVDGVVDRETFNEEIDVAGLAALMDVRCDSLPWVP
jgi:hypothetical protein